MNAIVWAASSSVLIAAVLLTRAVFGKKMRPGLRYAMWALVLIRLLVPVSIFSSPVSVGGTLEKTEVGRDVIAVSGLKSVSQSRTGAVTAVVSGAHAAGGEEVVVLDASPESIPRLQKTIRVRDILRIVRYTGTALTAVYFAAVNISFFLRLRRRRVPVSSGSPCRVYYVEGIESSCLFMNAVYVPKETAQDEEKLSCVLAHELSHRAHGDPFFALLRCAAIALHWYNPLVWAAAFVSRRDSELFADAGAIKRLGEDRRVEYGKTLIALTVKPKTEANIVCTATAMTNGKAELKARIGSLAVVRRSLAAAVAAIMLSLTAAGCTFAGGRIGIDAYKTAPKEGEVEIDTALYVPDDAPDTWFAEEAWKLVREICDMYRLSIQKDGFDVSVQDDWNVSEVRFGGEEDHLVEVYFTKDENGVSRIAGCSLNILVDSIWDQEQDAQAGIDLGSHIIRVVKPEEFNSVRASEDESDEICAVRYAAGKAAEMLMKVQGELACRGARVLSVREPNAELGRSERYSAEIAVFPENADSFCASSLGCGSSAFYTGNEYPECRLWLVREITAEAMVNSDGTVTVYLSLPKINI